MHSHHIADHTADIRLDVRADSLLELFTGAIQGLAEILKPGFCRADTAVTKRQQLKVTSLDVTTLLIDVLSEVLTRSYLDRTVFCGTSWTRLTETQAELTILGAPTDGFQRDVKAVTYHEADVREIAPGQWQTTIVFDI